jgi:PKD-like domain/Secretion system C-terminal sorting domain
LLCDTDADPDMSNNGSYTGSNCTWNANGKTDEAGDVFHPDPRNFMAYGNRFSNGTPPVPCRNHFTTGQKNVIQFFATKNHLQFRPEWIRTDANSFDRYEPDEADIAARPIALGEIQSHTFHTAGRRDEVDWLSFVFPATGSLNNYQLIVTQSDASAVDVSQVAIFLRNAPPNNTAGARIPGVTSSTAGNIVTFNIPCGLLTRGATFLIRLPRGTSGTADYDVELRETDNVVSTILGPSIVCNSNAIFSLSSVPSGAATITWTPSTNIVPVSGQGTPVYTVIQGYSGPGSLSVVFSGTCGNAAAIQKTVRVGGFTSSEHPISGPPTICQNSSAPFSTRSLVGASYSWWISADWILISGQGTPSINVVTSSYVGSRPIKVKLFNECDPIGSETSFVTSVINCGTNSVSISPNPTSSVVTVEIVEEDATNDRMIEDIKLLDNIGTEIKTWHGASRKVELDVRGLQRGFYYVKVFYSGEISTSRILLE